MSGIVFDEFCMGQNCEHLILWDHDVEIDGYESCVQCISCVLVGQSYNVEAYPDECPYLREIKKYEEEQTALRTWSLVKNGRF